MCAPLLPLAIIGAGALGAGASIYSSSKAASAQKRGQDMAAADAQRQAQRAETQFNAANQKQPGIAALYAANKNGASRGLGSTFLSGGAPNMSSHLGGAPSLLGGK
jgi:hypothetical protein